jgi:hypothetical protein
VRLSVAALTFVGCALVGDNALAQLIPPFGPSPPPPSPPGYAPPGYPPPPRPYLPPKRDETPAGAFGGAAAGFRAARLDADIDGADDSYGYLGSIAWNGAASLKFLTMHSVFDAHVGGGPEGVEARVGGQFTFGVIGHFGQTNGMFIRVGLGGNYEGNDRYFFSHFDLPVGEGGFQFHGDHFGFEVGVRGGATLTGRLGLAPSDNRAFGVVGSWGGYALLAASTNDSPLPGGWLDVGFTRYEGEQPIHEGSGRVCGGYIAFACLDGRILHSDLPFGTAAGTAGTFDGAVGFYAGATLGVGAAFALDGVGAFAGF